jgi:hypothetical protein
VKLPLNITKFIKSRNISWTGHVAHMEYEKYISKRRKIRKEETTLGDLDMDGRIILK